MNHISQALVKFQGQLKPVAKDSENPFFKSSYANLSSILQAVLPILSANGLAVIQPMKVQDGVTILVTRLIHESGEFIESEMILPSHPDPQKLGSLITYYKRYQLQALLGVNTEEDDDGNSVSKQYQSPVNAQKPISGQQQVTSYPASDAQKFALKKLNIAFNENITKTEASNLIAQGKK
jgi:hypothetical protein